MGSTLKIFTIVLLVFQIGYSQKNILKFKISTNYLDGVSYLEKTKNIDFSKSKIDISFYNEYFPQFYNLPKKLINKKLKNQQITEWAFENRPKKRNNNWTEFYKYDAEGKLIEYMYSGCLICSQFSWGCKLIYNTNNKIIEQQIFNLSTKPILENEKIKTTYDFENQLWKRTKYIYNNSGNLVKIEKFGQNGIEEKIELLD